jgi:exodeoxyribonuclease VII large subunit
MNNEMTFSVSEFVAVFNQTLEFAYPGVTIVGELANFRISKNRWVYFDLKDENCTLKFFGTVYQLPGPLEEGMLLKVKGQPRLHNTYGFSINIQSIMPAGEGTIKRAAELLKAKLTKEGLFELARKRILPYPPERIGLITSKQSAAYSDFIKILKSRWSGLDIELIDVQVQGELAASQIIEAIEQFNAATRPPDALVVIRGGGSPEDLATFNTEPVTRAIARSRAPTLVAIGHERDVSLCELAADQRSSTPSNAAEMLTPDRKQMQSEFSAISKQLRAYMLHRFTSLSKELKQRSTDMESNLKHQLNQAVAVIESKRQLLEAFNPSSILSRGYAVVRHRGRSLKSTKSLKRGAIVDVDLYQGSFSSQVTKVIFTGTGGAK